MTQNTADDPMVRLFRQSMKEASSIILSQVTAMEDMAAVRRVVTQAEETRQLIAKEYEDVGRGMAQEVARLLAQIVTDFRAGSVDMIARQKDADDMAMHYSREFARLSDAMSKTRDDVNIFIAERAAEEAMALEAKQRKKPGKKNGKADAAAPAAGDTVPQPKFKTGEPVFYKQEFSPDLPPRFPAVVDKVLYPHPYRYILKGLNGLSPPVEEEKIEPETTTTATE